MESNAEAGEDNAPPPPQVSNWDLDSDEIASIASEDLYAHRPNRWKGPKSTWRTYTREERDLWRSLRRVEDQDLGVHLYNAFALKRRGKDATTAAEMTVQTEDGREMVWAPPKVWTAWPLKESQVPREGLFKAQNDQDEPFTFRKKETKAPSSDLQDEVAAMILRLAKQRFRRRTKRRDEPVQQSIEAPPSDEDASLPSSPPADSSSAEEEGVSDAGAPPSATAQPEIVADDAASEAMLRPSVRHILTQLDRTLTVLHNARVAGLTYLSDSDSSTDESDTGSPRRKRGRPRRTPQPGEDAASSTDATTGGPRRRGRPRKVHTPREGETEEEMQIRVARESHRRLPFTEADREAAFESWLRKGDAKLTARGPDADAKAESTRVSALNRWGLRDWSDVVGAAALAGFPDAVIARTTQRCASLFGESMTLRRLGEAPASRGANFSSKDYRPEKITLSDAGSSEEEGELQTLQQRRIASRQASLARSHSPSRGRQSQSTQSRSRSRSSGLLLFCPVSSCDRAANGFSRRSNLRRHMQLLHPGYEADSIGSEDETVGAIAVDGFLRPIQTARGWRGDDVQERKRKRFYGLKDD